MNGFFATVTAISFLAAGMGTAWSQDSPKGPPKWSHGPPESEDYFPIAVWLQNPRNASKFKNAGINLYVGLWKGPNEEQLATLTKAGMPVIRAQNAFALRQKDNPIIVGWMHGDEPDNAQSLGKGRGYGPPILPEVIVRDYERMRAADPTRPVLLNLGQGVAWDNYIGRGVRRNHPEDYPEYITGCDVASFDIYPAVHKSPEVAGKLEFVARGVERLVKWSGEDRPVWNCIECTHIGNPRIEPTPDQVRSEVWMALIRGSRGLIYFVHQFKPTFREAALLDDPEMLAAVTAINRQIRELAPVLNRPSVREGIEVKSSAKDAQIAWMLKRSAEAIHLFAVNLANVATEATFTVAAIPPEATVEVLGESRTVSLKEGRFDDSFKPYGVHLYKWQVSSP